MREERLLERIRLWEKEPANREGEDESEITMSILRHLQRILNTWQGNVLIAEDYGVPVFSDFLYTVPESTREIERTIKLVILKYEPRLRAVKVKYIPREEGDAFSLRFQINARLSIESKSHILFETFIDSSGKINVKD